MAERVRAVIDGGVVLLQRSADGEDETLSRRWRVRAKGGDPAGAVDASSQVQSLVDAIEANGGGVLEFDPGDTFKIDQPITHDPGDGELVVIAHGATINYTGSSGVLWDIDSSGSAATAPRPTFLGGRWVGTSNADGCFKVTDTGRCRFRDLTVQAFGGPAWWLRNVDVWTENTSVSGCHSIDNARVAQFDPASVTGGGGTQSFARTRFRDLFATGGDDFWFYCRGGVYDSIFDMIAGNCGSSLTSVFYVSDTMGGTHIEDLKVESGGASTTLFTDGGFSGSKPSVGRYWLRDDITFGDATAVSNPPV